MGSEGLEHHGDDGRMTLGQRAFWTLVSAFSAVLLYLAVICALPRDSIGY